MPSEQLLRKIANEYVYRMKEREPVHDERTWFGIKKGRKMFWSDLGLLTHHEPEPKKNILAKFVAKQNTKASVILGDYVHKLLSSKDLTYYNGGVTKTNIEANGKKIGYGD